MVNRSRTILTFSIGIQSPNIFTTVICCRTDMRNFQLRRLHFRYRCIYTGQIIIIRYPHVNTVNRNPFLCFKRRILQHQGSPPIPLSRTRQRMRAYRNGICRDSTIFCMYKFIRLPIAFHQLLSLNRIRFNRFRIGWQAPSQRQSQRNQRRKFFRIDSLHHVFHHPSSCKNPQPSYHFLKRLRTAS